MRHFNLPSLRNLPTDNEGKRGKNKTGANISLNTVFLMDTDPHVFAVGVRVQIMRVYVERNESDGIKCGRVNDGHVIGCIDAVGGHICSST